ncbi:uncharacterized protein LOC113139023 [Mastacembelus armatus]|uniref:uncharacterized protein LOC113139023 n=1 Tax=Mastacembelus armatus TaxID=205130 RepID=UPI000E465ADE|nr:uncharacterized protein LOC113139023 [Mastacembelus armatus]
MKYRAGFLRMVCAWMVILLTISDTGHAPKKYSTAFSCKPKELTALIGGLVQESMTRFDEANGQHLGTWSPGFPELQVQQNSSLHGSKVQCSLLFMAHGLEKVLEDQRNNLNPGDVSLHEKLRETIFRVAMLAKCLKDTFGWECSQKPSPPEMPKHAFERKQWSHTLLKTAKKYLSWLERNFVVHIKKVKGRNTRKRTLTKATLEKYLEGSGHLL